MRGVSTHNFEGVKLYEKLAQPLLETREEISIELYEYLKSNIMDKEWRIFEPGIGGGWIAFDIIRMFLDDVKGPNEIYLYGVDTSKGMLEHLIEKLIKLFEAKAIDYNYIQKKTSYNIIINNRNKKINILLKTKNCLDCEFINTKKFNIIFIFFLFHHLGNKWKQALEIFLNHLDDDSLIVLSEISGDQAAWSYNFSKIEDIFDLNMDLDRMQYIKFIMHFQKVCKQFNWFNARTTTAANLFYATDILNHRGFQEESRINRSYKKKIKIADWLISGGFNINGANAKGKRVFSVFPFFKSIDRKKNFEKKCIEFFKDDSMISKDEWIISNNSLLLKDINIIDSINYKIFNRRGNSCSLNNTKLKKEILFDHFENLYIYDNIDNFNYNSLYDDISFLLQFEVVKNPDAFMPISWDLMKEEWIKNVPILVKNPEGVKQIISYYYLSKKILANYRLSTLLYKQLPQKIKFSYVFSDDNNFKINCKLKKDGSINEIFIIINIKTIIKKKFLQDIQVIKEKIYNYSNKMKRVFLTDNEKYIVINNIQIKDVIEKIEKDELINKTDVFNTIEDIFDKIVLSQYAIHLENFFEKISIFYDNNLWKISRNECVKVIKSIAVSGLCDIKEIKHYLSSVSLDRNSKNLVTEISTGGIILHLNEQSKIEEDELVTLLNLKNRSLFLEQHKYFTEKKMLKQMSKTAIISILVDSFAHNISAHSLAALKWWFEIRANKIYNKRIRLIKKDGYPPIELLHELQPPDFDKKLLKEYAKRSNTFFKTIGLGDSSNDNNFTSLQEIIQFMDKSLEKKALTYSANDDQNKLVGEFHLPIPIDHVMWKFMRFMRDKAAFWSGVTRDLPFGGETKNLYTVLWNDFADNPLFLGTIAHSEQIHKINIHVDVPHVEGTEFAVIDMSVIKYEEQISNNEETEERENDTYSHYMMSYPGENHQIIREELQKDNYNIFFPGGIVGEHALFTLFENTLRNVKHLTVTEKIKKEGLNFKIKIRPEILKSSSSKKIKLIEIEVLLDEKNTLFEGDKQVVDILIKHTQKEVVTKDGGPRLGGNSQDKICAAMLFNNQFITVEPKLKYTLSKRDKRYYNKKDKFYWIGFKQYKDKKNPRLGKISKYFYLWKGEYIFNLQSEEDFDLENLSRFKFLYINNSDKNKEEILCRRARENGIIRIIKSSEINIDLLKKEIEGLSGIIKKKKVEKIHKNIYDYWLDKFCFNNQIIIAGKSGKPFDKYGDLKEDKSIDLDEMYIIDQNRIRNINSISDKDCDCIISLAHGNNTNPKKVLDFRSHGKLVEHFYEDKDLPGIDFINEEDGYNKTSIASEFIECVTTKIHIFDNRIYDRIPKNKYALYRNKLNLTFNKEISKKENKQDYFNYCWQDFKELFSKQNEQINILIMHLSFIEALKDSEGEKYSENNINKFIKNEIKNLDNIALEKFILVITTGRGRYEWQKKINKKYAKFTIFRPIESLLSAVEDAVSFKDDFQIKFNLMKVIFGS